MSWKIDDGDSRANIADDDDPQTGELIVNKPDSQNRHLKWNPATGDWVDSSPGASWKGNPYDGPGWVGGGQVPRNNATAPSST